MTAAERDQGVTAGPCGPHAGVREAFAEWLARVGPQRICDGSGMRDGTRYIACPGCAACCTSATTCPAFWDERGPDDCVFCGGEQEAHRRMPEPPEPEPVRGFRIVAS